MSAKEMQVGGAHYLNTSIPPRTYIKENELGWDEGNVIKYVTRYAHKGGREDLEKAIHYLQLLLEDSE